MQLRSRCGCDVGVHPWATIPKKPRRCLLPDLESMAAQRSFDKQAIEVVKTKHEEMKPVNLDVVSGERLQKLDEVKVPWLMAKYGVMACLKVMIAMKTVVSRAEWGVATRDFTNRRAGLHVCSMVEDEVTRGDAAAIHKFLLRWHGSHSVEVNKNINLGYSQDQGYS